MNYNKFQIMSVKARMSMIQERLIELGYKKCQVTGKRDKPTIKAIQDVQKHNGIVPNGVVCKRTFEALFGAL